jgi:hypothetical protein
MKVWEMQDVVRRAMTAMGLFEDLVFGKYDLHLLHQEPAEGEVCHWISEDCDILLLYDGESFGAQVKQKKTLPAEFVDDVLQLLRKCLQTFGLIGDGERIETA